MSAKDWISFFVGAVIGALGLLPLILNKESTFSLSFISQNVLVWVLAIGGFT